MESARIDIASAFDLDALAAGLNGLLLRPGDVDYDAARHGHNLAHERMPAAIVRAADASDVALAVDAAQQLGLELAVKSGGHSIAGHSTGDQVLVIDLSAMKGLHIDPDSRLVYAQSGLTAGEVTRALAAHDLAIPFGDTASVGIGGITLGGGIGYLVRKHGLTIDHLEAVELVTADGRIVTASAQEHADLFWAVRGGGGNFGIVTRFVYRAVPVGMTYGGALVLPATVETIVGVARAAEAAPEGLTTITDMIVAPPMPFLPPEWVGRLVLYVTAVYAGDPADGPAVMAPFRAIAEPVADLLGPMPYAGIYGFTAHAEPPSAYAIRSSFLASFDEATAHVAIAAVESAPTPMAMFHFRILGGQLARVPADATAFAHRDARFMVMVMAGFEGDGAAAAAEWAGQLHAALAPQADGVYSNFLGDEGEARVHEAYPTATYARLAAVKRAYDPQNVFHRNQNIRPAS